MKGGAIAAIILGAAGVAGGMYFLYTQIQKTNTALNVNAQQTNQNTAAAASATGTDLGYLQEEVNQLQTAQDLNQVTPSFNFGAPQLGAIAAPNLPANISLTNQAPVITNTPTNNNSASQTVSQMNGQKTPKFPLFSAGEQL